MSHKHSAVKNTHKSNQKAGQSQPCKWRGRANKNDRKQCSARNADCRKCGKHGHFEKVCRSAV